MAAEADSLFAPLVAAAERAGVADFLRWWRGELVGLLPAAWRERLASRDVAHVSVEGDEWIAYRPVAGRLAQSGRANLGSLDAAGRRGAFRRLLADQPGAAGNVWLVLPRESVLLREVSLPLAAEEALREAVGFELDRLTPLPAERAWFDFRVTGRDAAAQKVRLTLAVAAREPIESRLAELRELGATVPGVGLVGDVGGAAAPLNLLPPEKRDHPATSGAALTGRFLAALAAALAIAALAYPVWLKREAVIALHPRMDKARADAEVAERLAKQIETLAAEHNFVLGRKQGQQPVVAILEDLSRLLPDTTWVQQLDVKSGLKSRELQIAGETGSSSQLIEVLEKSGKLANAGFKSPLTKGVTPGTERFLLAAEIKPRPLPEPIAESALLSGSATPRPGAIPAPAPAVAAPAKPSPPATTPAAPAASPAAPPARPAAEPAVRRPDSDGAATQKPGGPTPPAAGAAGAPPMPTRAGNAYGAAPQPPQGQPPRSDLPAPAASSSLPAPMKPASGAGGPVPMPQTPKGN